MKSLGEIDNSLTSYYQETQQKGSAAYLQYAHSVQANMGKADAVNAAFSSYTTAVQELQSGFQKRWMELTEQASKRKSNSYREFVGKVQAAWSQLSVGELTPAEAAMVGQWLVGVAAMSQMFARAH